MTHRVFFFGGGGRILTAFLYDGTSKSRKAAMSYMTYTKWITWEKSKMQQNLALFSHCNDFQTHSR
jgi:hypothetical protein